MLFRKHFKKAAEILKKYEATDECIEEFVEFFSKTNPDFDKVKFRESCKWKN